MDRLVLETETSGHMAVHPGLTRGRARGGHVTTEADATLLMWPPGGQT